MPVRYCHVKPTAKSIVLIGMMGAGKSSVGCCLQRRMKLPVVEIDDIVASKFAMTISEIFAEHGEDQFREAEAEVLRNLKAKTERTSRRFYGPVTRYTQRLRTSASIHLCLQMKKLPWRF